MREISAEGSSGRQMSGVKSRTTVEVVMRTGDFDDHVLLPCLLGGMNVAMGDAACET